VSRRRLLAIAAAFMLVIAAFGHRLYDLQLSPDPALAEGLGQRFRHDEVMAMRGSILDRRGRPLAVSLPVPTIIANPSRVASHEIGAVVDQLAPLVSTSPALLASRLESDKQFAFVDRQVDIEVGDAVEELGIPGIRIDSELRRENSAGDCSGLAVIGRVDIDHQGISGIEEAYDDLLTGVNGKIVREASSDGSITIPEGHEVFQPAVPGSDLQLTLDGNVQYRAERILTDAVSGSRADSGIILASVPATGEVIAAANVTRDTVSGAVACSTTNLAMISTFEPGSVMKPITVASVLDAGLAEPQELLDLPDRLSYAIENNQTKVYADWFTHTQTFYTPTEIVVQSSNIGAITLAGRLGPQRFYERLLSFGFGSKTALDFKGESRGILRPLDNNVLELPAVAIGQSIAVTPIQMLQAYNVIANGGVKVDPVLVVDDIGSGTAQRVVSETAAGQVLEMMRGVVAEGTGTQAAVPGYDVAGKTGTAWQPCGDRGGYDCDGSGARHYTAAFAGIVSNDAGPALSILVIIDNPRGDRVGGGSVAAPVFAEIAQYAVRQLEVPPQGSSASAQQRVRAEPAVRLALADAAAAQQADTQ